MLNYIPSMYLSTVFNVLSKNFGEGFSGDCSTWNTFGEKNLYVFVENKFILRIPSPHKHPVQF